MPTALLKACSATPGCPNLTEGGACPSCARASEQRRGSAASRGYNVAWSHFRTWVRNRMIRLGIAPICGAILPGGPVTADSRCKAAGRINATRLNLDHEPPLTDSERAAAQRGDRRAIDDATRVQWLCDSCHSAKSLKEQRGAA